MPALRCAARLAPPHPSTPAPLVPPRGFWGVNDTTEMQINGKTWVPKSQASAPNGPMSMLVLHRGFIFVGHWDGETMAGASNVRKWSTGGMGGLSLGAKSSGAVLDKCRDLTPAPSAILFVSPLPKDWISA